MTVSDIDRMTLECLTDGTHALRRVQELESRRSGRRDSFDRDPVDDRLTMRRCDDDNSVPRRGQPRGEVLQVKLDAPDARMIPVADEGDLQVAIAAALGSRRATM